MHDSLTILGHGFLLYRARVSTYGGSSNRRGTLDGNIFRQHHRGIVRMKFSRSGSNPPSHPWDKKGTRFVYEAKLSKGGQGM